jgi:XTP/dITP diphosphohydrolase
MKLTRVLFASTNYGKIKEFRSYFSMFPFQLLSLNEIKLPLGHQHFKETGKTFFDNAKLKAEYYGHLSGLPTLADDSGLEIDALGGMPVVKSRRFAANDELRINKVLKLLVNIPKIKRTARFISAIALYLSDSQKTIIFTGLAEGYITFRRLGKNGFGYDPIFFSYDLKKTFAQADLEAKNKISHRGKALIKLGDFLKRSEF